MEIGSRPGKASTPEIQSTGKFKQQLDFTRVVLCGLVLAFVSLACAIGVLDQNDPLFSARSSAQELTQTTYSIVPTGQPAQTESIEQTGAAIIARTTEIPTPQSLPVDTAPLLYYTQAGDTLPVIAIRFGVDASEINSPSGDIPQFGLLNPDILLVIP